MSMDGSVRVMITSVLSFVIGACASSGRVQRQLIRDQVAAGTKFYCEFLNGEKYTDIDVALNIAIGEKCDVSQSYSITGYRSTSEIPGVIYCCNLKVKGDKDNKDNRRIQQQAPSAPKDEGLMEPAATSPEAGIKPSTGGPGANRPDTIRAPAQSR